MTEKKQPLIILTGPTAVGKTQASIALAKALDAQIISADSMQVYRHMDIGSAKITKEEMQGVKHYLVDVLEPAEEFNVVRFQQMAKEAMAKIIAEGHVPLVVGGTGFYIQALLYDIDFTETAEDAAYRLALAEEEAANGPGFLHARLAAVDPASAAQIPPGNVKRIIRALEFYAQTGRSIAAHNEEQRRRESPYDFHYFVLNRDRAELYRRIDLRVDKMMAEGLLEEAQRLRAMGCTREMVSMQGLGYKELLDHLDGLCTLEEAAETIKRSTRHFAKRQLTWFRRERSVEWIDLDRVDGTELTELLLKKIKGNTFAGDGENGLAYAVEKSTENDKT